MTQDKLPKSHDSLVDALSKDLKPVKKASAKMYFFVWFVPSLIIAIIATFAVGYNGSLSEKFTSPFFIATIVVLFSGVILASWLAIKMSIPGEEPKKNIRYTVIFIPLVMGSVILWRWFSVHSLQYFISSMTNGLPCTISILLVALLPLIFLSFIAFKLAPLNSFGTAIMISLAALLLSAIGGQVHCCDTDACHLAIWHYLPVFIGCILIALPLQYILSRWKNVKKNK